MKFPRQGLGAASKSSSQEEEDDYMSASFLTELETAEKNPKPNTYMERRKQALRSQEQRGRTKSLREQEQETREKGLKTEITEENKGFQMLAKLGYKKGMPLGSTTAVEEKRVEPIPVVMKSDRFGLGLEEQLDLGGKRQRTEEEEKALEEEREQAKEEFRTTMNQRFAAKRIQSDVRKARKMCEQLDLGKDLPRNDFWFPEKKVVEDAGDGVQEDEEASLTEFELMEPSIQLTAVNTYLRTVHHYCLWCGEAYHSAEELEQTCPGDTADDHDI